MQQINKTITVRGQRSTDDINAAVAQLLANLDYIAMMSDIELDDDDEEVEEVAADDEI